MTNPNPSPIGIGFGFVLFGTNGDTELFEKPSNINGFETFGQQIFLLLTS